MSCDEVTVSVVRKVGGRAVGVALKRVVGRGTGIDTDEQIAKVVEDLATEADRLGDISLDVVGDLNGCW